MALKNSHTHIIHWDPPVFEPRPLHLLPVFDLTTSNLWLPLVGGVKLVLLIEGSVRDGDGFDRLKKIIGIKLVFLHSVIHSIGL